MDNKKSLRSTSILIITLAALDILDIVMEFIFSGMPFVRDHPDVTVQNVTNVIMVVILVITAVLIAAQLFVGYKGLQMVKAPGENSSHIRVAKALMIANIVMGVVYVIGMIGETFAGSDLLTVGLCVADASIMWLYVREAGAVLAEYRK